jgi:adenosylhomocysteine nucleosidase
VQPYDARDMERIAVFAALQWECRAVVRQLHQVRRDRLDGFTRWRGSAPRCEVVVVKTGIGMQRAAAAIDALGDLAQFRLIVSTGCAGGLAPHLDPGDLVLATAVVCDATAARRATDCAWRADALTAVAGAGLRGAEGPMLCSAAALASAAAKRGAAAAGAIAVEMESDSIAARAAGAGIPFLSVRAILDGADHELCVPDRLTNAATGSVRPLAVAGYVATHPNVISELIALQRMQRAARESLERFFARWLATAHTDLPRGE